MMTDEELVAITRRNEARSNDPAYFWQSGCAGTTRGRHIHDDHCAPSPYEDVRRLCGALIAAQHAAAEWKHAAESTLQKLSETVTLYERAADLAKEQARQLFAVHDAQRRSFAFGNANSANADVTREMVDDEADKMGAEQKRADVEGHAV